MSVLADPIAELRSSVAAGSFREADGLETYRLGDRTPRAVVFPADEAEVSRVLALASRAELGVVPWGGGCHQSIGHPPRRYDLALDLTRLNRLLAHEPADMTATAQAGIRMDDLQRRLGDRNQFLPLEMPIPERATLGGALAVRLSGPLRCRYGTARDLILGVRIAHPDGTITKGGAKVVKNATAYDITKLYVGSHGTLGIILEATFRLYPRPEVERGWSLTAGDPVAAQALANRILGSHLVPSRVELLDEAAARMCGVSGPGLVVSISGLPETVEGQLLDLKGMAGEFGAELTELRDTETAWKALADFPWRAGGWVGQGPQALWRAGVPPAECANAIRAIREGAGKQAAVAIAATVSHGILRGSFQAGTPDGLVQSLMAARENLVGLGGYLTVLSLPEAVRDAIDVWGAPPDALDVMQRLKAAFDPKGILNAGRFVGGI